MSADDGAPRLADSCQRKAQPVAAFDGRTNSRVKDATPPVDASAIGPPPASSAQSTPYRERSLSGNQYLGSYFNGFCGDYGGSKARPSLSLLA
jgi:hypothetical protein